MLKVFNKAPRTFLLFAEDRKTQMKILPLGTANVPDEFAGDVTFRKAVAAGELVIWQEAREVDAAQRTLEKVPEESPEKETVRKAARQPKHAFPSGEGGTPKA